MMQKERCHAHSAVRVLLQHIAQSKNKGKLDQVLKVESKYHHLGTFSDDPGEDLYALDVQTNTRVQQKKTKLGAS